MTSNSDPAVVLVLGASGATGRLLVKQLLDRGVRVRAVVRAGSALPKELRSVEGLTLHRVTLLELEDAELGELVKGCDAVASCLGHNLTLRGIFGSPRRLVTEATRRLCRAIEAGSPSRPVRFLLMNTTGNRNRDLLEPVSFAHRCVIGLLRWTVPPHADNEDAAEFLRVKIGMENPMVEWAAIRPDGLTDESEVTDYDIHPSPTRSAIFDAGKTSRINVAHFMARLAVEDEFWAEQRGRMPVIYNR